MILAEAIFAKNALFRHGNASPYEAVFGRTPALLDALHFESVADISERDCERLRHAAIQSMVQASAHDRVVRANASRARPAGELLGIEVGDLVEFFRKPSTKDTSGWHGPATVVDTTSMRDGQLGLRWQGRHITCRLQDIRRALTYTCLLMTARSDSPTTIVQQAAEQHVGVVVRLGWFQSESRWLAFEANRRYARELLAGLHMASCLLHLSGVVSFRFGCEVNSLPAVNCDDTLLIWWPIGLLEEWCHVFLPGQQAINFARLCPTLGHKVAFLQFFCESAETVASVRQVVADVPNLGGPYDPQMPPPRDLTHRVRLGGRMPALAIEDGATRQPEHFDIATPPASSGPMSDLETEGEETEAPTESVESVFMQYAVTPPLVYTDVAHEAAFVFSSAELERELPSLEIAPPLEFVNEQVKSQYMSLLGGLAWVVQTRPDIAVFISALQRQLATALDNGTNALFLDMVIDHRGLLDAAASDENKSTDSAVLLHLMKLREDLKSKIRTLFWVDTRSMVADALNKGAIDRKQLHELCSEGTWTISQPLVSHRDTTKGK
ncbi:unnamed protein product [Symbiodinium pilosum]|uniref:Uncharacterized protein n=1 Tax=Symbiodinium pilosum TaxID=2952 RepID=A0A812IPL8_SYMPI|nr:unnamed protein product [Symbiodinium pilosum]